MTHEYPGYDLTLYTVRDPRRERDEHTIIIIFQVVLLQCLGGNVFLCDYVIISLLVLIIIVGRRCALGVFDQTQRAGARVLTTGGGHCCFLLACMTTSRSRNVRYSVFSFPT